jgi:hypothetical protein
MNKSGDIHEKAFRAAWITVPRARNKKARDKLGKDRKLKHVRED